MAELAEGYRLPPWFGKLGIGLGALCTAFVFYVTSRTAPVSRADLTEVTAAVVAWPPPRSSGLDLQLAGRPQVFYIPEDTLRDVAGLRDAPSAAPPGTEVTLLSRDGAHGWQVFGLRAGGRVLLSLEDAVASDERNVRFGRAFGWFLALVTLWVAGTYWFLPGWYGLPPR